MIMQDIINFIDDFKNKYIRIIANIVCMVASCGLTVYGVIQLFANPLLQCFMGIFIGVIDIWMQYLLAYGKWLWKQRDNVAFQYFVAYGLYALFFNFFFAIGFFMMEIDVTEYLHDQHSISDTTEYTRKRIKEIDEDLKIIRDYQKTETGTGFGRNAKTLKEDKKRLEKEREEYVKTLSNNSKTIKSDRKVNRNIFNSLEMVFQPLIGWMNANVLKIIVFGMLVLVMQFGLIKTSWNINPHSKVNTNTLSDDKKEILKWLDAAFEGRSNGALNGISSIAEVTGLTTDRCIHLRDYLANLKVNGGMAISYKQGVCKANYNKNFIRDYILSH
ncbi:MAG: hypothetical protein GX638_13875 [Crenarchaeota archaeon]|nr:hypothetical protein [Thermoproteota archaeon]